MIHWVGGAGVLLYTAILNYLVQPSPGVGQFEESEKTLNTHMDNADKSMLLQTGALYTSVKKAFSMRIRLKLIKISKGFTDLCALVEELEMGGVERKENK